MLATVGIPLGIANVYKALREKFFVLQGPACGEACHEKMIERCVFYQLYFLYYCPIFKRPYILEMI